MTRKDMAVADALDVIARALRSRVEHGSTIKGTLDIGDLEVEIAVIATRKIKRSDVERYQKAALELLEREGWRDRCPTSVKNRSPWSISKTKTCDARVTTALVFRRYDTADGKVVESEGYRFCCGHHVEHSRDVIATVPLPVAQLDRIREQRRKEYEIKRREEETRENKDRVEKALGRPLGDAEMVKVKMPSELSAAQRAIARQLVRKRYGDAHDYMRMVVSGQSPREIDYFLDVLAKEPS